MEITWRVISGKVEGEDGGKSTGNKKCNWHIQNGPGEVKNSIGNGETEEPICTNHGHELRWGNTGGRSGAGWRGIKGEKMGQL